MSFRWTSIKYHEVDSLSNAIRGPIKPHKKIARGHVGISAQCLQSKHKSRCTKSRCTCDCHKTE